MSTRRVVTTGVALVVLVGVWVLLAPHQLGGASTYVTVQGSSMEPTMHTGDLVVLRAQDGYAVGDVVAYRSDMAGAIVLHRIVGIATDIPGATDGGRYVLQGDDNDFLDRFEPADGDVLGRQVLHVPGGSRLVDILGARSFLFAAVIAGALLVIASAITSRRQEKRRRRRRNATEEVNDDDQLVSSVN